QGFDSGCSGRGWQSHWPNTNASDRLCIGQGLTRLRRRSDSKRQRSTYRWMAGIPRLEQEGLCSRCDSAPRKKECCYRTPSARSPCHIALEALAHGNSSRRSEPQASRLLPRRIHFPIQPADLASPRQVILPPSSTGSRRGTEIIQIAHMWPPATDPKTPTTTYSGYLSKVHTPIRPI